MSSPETPRMSPRMVVLAAIVVCVAVVAGVAVATRGFGLFAGPAAVPPDAAAQQRCERDVVARMVTPESATVSDVTVMSAQLDPEITDLAPLSAGPLAGVERSRISVRSVTGVVTTPNQVGGTLDDPFTCRAYFIDGQLADTLVLLGHDH